MTTQAPESFDIVLQELGPLGRHQLIRFALILLPVMSGAMCNAQYIFNAADVKYRCIVPECEPTPSSSSYSPGPWAAFALQPGSSCDRRVPNPGATCQAADFTSQTQKCDQWIYQTRNSIVAEFNLACHNWKRVLVGTVHNSGKFSALFVVGMISDKFGRKKVFVTAATMAGTMGLIRSFSTSYAMYLVFEFLDACIDAGVYSTAFILALEMIPPKRRVLAGCTLASMYALGQVLAAGLNWRWPYWRTFTRIIYTPSYFYISYWFLLDESVRWLTVKGKMEEAMKILRKVAEDNKIKLNEPYMRQLLQKVAEATTGPPVSVFHQVLHSRILMTRVLVCSFCWATITFVYYGMSINSVSLAGSMHINYILTALAEIPGYLLGVFALDRFGRKRCILVALFTCTLTLVLAAVMPSWLSGLILALFLMGKAMVSMGISSIYILTLELFPTHARQSLMNGCSTVARFGSIAAPLTPLLVSYSPVAPYLMFGVMSGVAGFLLTLMPETLHSALPDSVEQAERISLTNVPVLADRDAPPAPAPQEPAHTTSLLEKPGEPDQPGESPASDKRKHKE